MAHSKPISSGTQIRLESTLNKIADLGHRNDEFKRSNTDHINHLGCWEDPRRKAAECKRCIALESGLNGPKEQFNQQAEELAKAERKVVRIKDVVEKYELRFPAALSSLTTRSHRG